MEKTFMMGAALSTVSLSAGSPWERAFAALRRNGSPWLTAHDVVAPP
jgi:hypothetical protein